jgi:hypothetical protein
MRIIPAKDIAPVLPVDLSALQVFSRQTTGPSVRLCAVGDIGLSGRAAETARQHGATALVRELTPFLRSEDIVFGNLESPLVDTTGSSHMFAAPPASATALAQSGFTVLNLANNHILDYGQAGLRSTLTAVRGSGMVALGAGESASIARQLVRTNFGNLRIGWLSCGRTRVPQNSDNVQYWEFDEHQLSLAVTCARQTVDVLIVSIHIGLMYMDYPRPEHKIMAEKLMAQGADLILMHHAHVLQGIQVSPENRVCCYNLGNFIFDWEEGNVKISIMLREQTEGAAFVFTLDAKGIAGVFAIPTWIDDSCQVHWATGDRGKRILARLERVSEALKDNYLPEFERQRADRNTTAILKVLLFHIRQRNWRLVLNALGRTRLEHIKMMIRWLTNRSNPQAE